MKARRWTLSELNERVKAALAVDYVPAASARVRAVPDRRTIRYYTTLGLIDRPAEMRGRTAYYGPRHLLQLVAIKRLQAEGLSLSRVQQRLTGLSDAALEGIARLPAAAEESGPAVPGPAAPRREDFWAAVPEPAPPAPPPATAPRRLSGLELVEGVTLLLADRRDLSAEDADALRAAAQPLLAVLNQRGLWKTS